MRERHEGHSGDFRFSPSRLILCLLVMISHTDSMDLADFLALPTSSKGVMSSSSPNLGISSSSKGYNPSFVNSTTKGTNCGVVKDSVIIADPKPNLLDVLELVARPCDSVNKSSSIKDLELENVMLRKLLAEKSSPPKGGAWKDTVGIDTEGRMNLDFIPPLCFGATGGPYQI